MASSSQQEGVDRADENIVYWCVVLSGVAGLVYEVVWARQLTWFMGTTAYAHAAVLTAFMAGLAAGSLTIGRLADRHAAPLRLYAWLELGIGAYGATTPWLFDTIQTTYAATAPDYGLVGLSGHLLRFALALAAVFAPAVLMGGTLPVLVLGLTSGPESLTRHTARLYGLNTAGAAGGAFAAGYVLLPALGVRATILAAVALNLGVAATILVLGRRLPRAGGAAGVDGTGRASTGATGHASVDSRGRMLLLGFAVSGFAALVYQLAWIKSLILVIGSSVYAFSATLATFLAGVALGSLLWSLRAEQCDADRSYRDAAVLQVGISISGLLGLFLIGQLPQLFLYGYGAGLHRSFVLFQVFIFLLCFLIMLGPTLMMGALFPLVTGLWTRAGIRIGRGVGTAYAANAVGTILGSVVGGLVLLPVLGIQNSLLLAAGSSAAVAALFWWLRPGSISAPVRWGGIATVMALYVGCVLVAPDWDRAIMESGVFVNTENWLRRPGATIKQKLPQRRLLYYREGVDGIVTVHETAAQRTLRVNAKTQASSRHDLPVQVMLGQLPMLLHAQPEKVLLIGFGSGTTAGAIATHDSVARLDVAELSREVVEASRYFLEQNRGVLDDSRVNIVVADGRNLLLAGRERYDVIVSQPSHPWISGVSNLFTKDFLDAARERLAPGGLMAQWFMTDQMPIRDLKSLLRTFHTVFPHVSVWTPLPTNLVLIGSTEPHALDYRRFEAALSRPAVQSSLQAAGVAGITALVNMLVLRDEALQEFTDGAVLNTDDRPRIEFNAPRNLYARTATENLRAVLDHLGQRKFVAPVANLVVVDGDEWRVPAVGLEIHDRTPAERATLDVRWLIQRQPRVDEQGRTSMATANQLWISWQAQVGSLQVLAEHRASPPTAAEARAVWQAVFPDGISDSGTIELSDGGSASWAAGTADDEGQVMLGAVWHCPRPTATVTRFVVLRRLPDPGSEALRSVISDSTRMFVCA